MGEDEQALRAPESGRVAQLWRGTGPDASPVGYLVTRECTHWDTVGPQSFPQHVNPQRRLEWHAHVDAAQPEDVYWDDPGAAAFHADAGTVRVGDETLVVRWLVGADAESVWARHGW
ncbi:hypothetical protein IF650_13310 [Cellulosimicrobium terreum]|nr:hypothetical protein [Cellulosimicrobium terreum]